MASARREFLETLATGAIGAAALGTVGTASAAAQAARGWDLGWTKKLTGKYRAVFDVPAVEDGYGALTKADILDHLARARATRGAPRTAASPERGMNRFELTRYLDYCAEMLALIGKLAALYGNHTRDGLVINAVNDIENLTGNLGRKIWQKITIISALTEDSTG
mgnify:CR=1 FL=1